MGEKSEKARRAKKKRQRPDKAKKWLSFFHAIRGDTSKTRDKIEQMRRENESWKIEMQEMGRMLEKK